MSFVTVGWRGTLAVGRGELTFLVTWITLGYTHGQRSLSIPYHGVTRFKSRQQCDVVSLFFQFLVTSLTNILIEVTLDKSVCQKWMGLVCVHICGLDCDVHMLDSVVGLLAPTVMIVSRFS